MPDTDTLERPDTQAATGLRVDRDTLLTAVRAVRQTVERRSTIPILSNVLLRVEDGLLTICASDLDHWSRRQIAYEGQAIDTTVEADRLVTAIDTLRPGPMEISYLHGAITIKQGRSTRKLMTLPSTDFPLPRAVADGTTFPIDAAPLLRVLDTARVCVSQEETRYYLNGIYFHVSDEGQPVLKAAATDGHRLARVTVARPDGADGMPGIIVPRKCIGELRKLLDEVEGSVQISLSASKIRFGLGSAILTSKLIDGTFPDYSRVIPTANDKLLKIDPRSFEDGVDRVATIATEKTRAVKMSLDKDRITLSVTSPENGTAAEEVPGAFQGEGFDIGFNARYLLDILGQIDSDLVELHLADAAAPTLIRESDASPALYVLMPMRV